MKLIVGLGNPDKKYFHTRHNFGFLVLDKLSSTWTNKAQWHCEIAKLENAILCRPLTYMNNSGQAVQAITEYYKIKAKDVIVIHDDLDLALGHIRLGIFSSSAGHNGIKSIQEFIGKDFIRIRLGIGKPINSQQEIVDYVLEKFSKTEMEIVDSTTKKASEIALKLLVQPLNEVQNLYN